MRSLRSLSSVAMDPAGCKIGFCSFGKRDLVGSVVKGVDTFSGAEAIVGIKEHLPEIEGLEGCVSLRPLLLTPTAYLKSGLDVAAAPAGCGLGSCCLGG